MLNQISMTQPIKKLTVILLGVLIPALFLTGNAAGQTIPMATQNEAAANAAGPASGPAAAPNPLIAAPAGQTWTSCTPAAVAVFPERIHVRCANSVGGGIIFFALSTQDASHAARMLSTLTTAHAMGRTLNILYDPADTSGTAIHCAESDCRLLVAAEFF